MAADWSARLRMLPPPLQEYSSQESSRAAEDGAEAHPQKHEAVGLAGLRLEEAQGQAGGCMPAAVLCAGQHNCSRLHGRAHSHGVTPLDTEHEAIIVWQASQQPQACTAQRPGVTLAAWRPT